MQYPQKKKRKYMMKSTRMHHKFLHINGTITLKVIRETTMCTAWCRISTSSAKSSHHNVMWIDISLLAISLSPTKGDYIVGQNVHRHA